MHVTIRQIGNSHGIVIPKPLMIQLGLEKEAVIVLEGDALVLRKPARRAREGWAAAAQAIAAQGDDALVLGEFANEGDEDLAW